MTYKFAVHWNRCGIKCNAIKRCMYKATGLQPQNCKSDIFPAKKTTAYAVLQTARTNAALNARAFSVRFLCFLYALDHFASYMLKLLTILGT